MRNQSWIFHCILSLVVVGLLLTLAVPTTGKRSIGPRYPSDVARSSEQALSGSRPGWLKYQRMLDARIRAPSSARRSQNYRSTQRRVRSPHAAIASFEQMTRARRSPNSLIVKFASESIADNALGALGLTHEQHLTLVPGLRRVRINHADPKNPVTDSQVAVLLEKLNALPFVQYAEPDYQVTSAAFPVTDQIDVRNAWWLSQINALDAWDLATDARTLGPIAVVDTGFDVTHPDLMSNLWSNPLEIAGNRKDDDGNGYIDDVHGLNFLQVPYQHGSGTAGTLCASGINRIGVVGAAWQCQLMDLGIVLDSHLITSRIVEGMQYAIDNGSRLSNHSWGLHYYSQAIADAVDAAQDAGHLMVVAAHNQSRDIDAAPVYPASLPNDNIVVVTASSRNEQPTGYANWGAVSVDLAAPADFMSTADNARYELFGGTSQATPLVTGAVALAWSQVPGWDYQQIRQHLFNSTRRAPAFDNLVSTGGILDMNVLLRALPRHPQLSVHGASVNEGAQQATFVVRLSPPAQHTVSVDVRTSDVTAIVGADYDPLQSRVEFLPGETEKSLTVSITDDVEKESMETIGLRLLDPDGADIAIPTNTIRIKDDDQFTTSDGELLIKQLVNGVLQSDAEYVIGYQFQVLQPMTIEQLGVLDLNGNGKLDNGLPIPVGLWNDQRQLLARVEVTADYTPIDASFMQPINPVHLLPGNTYVVAGAYQPGGEPWGYNGTMSGASTFVRTAGVYVSGTGLQFPNAIDNFTPNAYIGPTLRRSSQINQPSTLSVSTPATVSERDGHTKIQLRLQPPSSTETSVGWSLDEVDAQSDSDFIGSEGTVTFKPGDSIKVINIPIVNDTFEENEEHFLFRLGDPTGHDVAIVDRNIRIKIIDDDGLSAMPRLSIQDATVNENEDHVALHVRLNAPSTKPASAILSTVDSGDAQVGIDFVEVNQLLYFLPGSTEVIVPISIKDDHKGEQTERFGVRLHSVAGVATEDAVATVTIVDDDKPQRPRLTLNDVTAYEGTESSVLTVTLSEPTDEPVKAIVFTHFDGTATRAVDLYGFSQTLFIPPGQLSVSAPVAIIDDAIAEPNETLSLRLATLTGAVAERSSATLTIVDNDREQAVLALQDTVGIEGDTLVSVPIKLSHAQQHEVSVTVFSMMDGTASSGDDVYGFSRTLILESGRTEASVSVNLIDDALPEPTETFSLQLKNAHGAKIKRARAEVTIVDDDSTAQTPALSVGNITVSEDQGNARLMVYLSAAVDADVTVFTQSESASGQGEDFRGFTQILRFRNGATAQPVDVMLVNDDVAEKTETLSVKLSAPKGAGIRQTAGQITIIDDD